MSLRCASVVLLVAGVACDLERGGVVPAPPLVVGIEDVEVVRPDDLSDVRDIIFVESSREAWVLTGEAPFVRVYSTDGQRVRAFGELGEGPGDLKNPRNLARLGEAVLVWDVGLHRLTTFDDEGQLLSTHRIERSGEVRGDLDALTFGRARWLEAAGDILVLQEQTGRTWDAADLLQSRLVVLRPDGRQLGTLLEFEDVFAATRSSIGDARELVPVPIWTVCPGGRVAIVDQTAPAVLWYDVERSEFIRRDELPLTPQRVTADQVRSFVEVGLMNELGSQGYETTDQQIDQLIDRVVREGGRRGHFGRTGPVATGILCGRGDELWLAAFAPEETLVGAGRGWNVFALGELQAKLTFPAGFVPYELAGETVVGIAVDDLGDEFLAFVEVPMIVSLEGGARD